MFQNSIGLFVTTSHPVRQIMITAVQQLKELCPSDFFLEMESNIFVGVWYLWLVIILHGGFRWVCVNLS